MPSLDIQFMKQLHADPRAYDNFIETGTHLGGTILAMEPYFNRLYTIEVMEELWRNCKETYDGDKIEFLLGDSAVKLRELLPGIEGDSVIFLDGHCSGGGTGKGEKDCPLYEEIESIMTLHKGSALVIIDDARLFGKGPIAGGCEQDWEDIHIDTILEQVASRLTEHYFLPSSLDPEDRMVLHLGPVVA